MTDGTFRLDPAGEVAIGVADLARSRAFYGVVLGLRELSASTTSALFDCGDMRLRVEVRADHAQVRPGSPICFRVDDLGRARQDLERRGVIFTRALDMAGELGGQGLWMAHFRDPDGHHLALMAQVPKGFAP